MNADRAKQRAEELGPDVLLTLAEVIELVGVSERQVRRVIGTGKLPSSMVPGKKGLERRVRLGDLIGWLDARQEPAKTADTGSHEVRDELRALRELTERLLDAQAAAAAEIHDLRGQLAQTEARIMQKALTGSERRGWLARLFGRKAG